MLSHGQARFINGPEARAHLDSLASFDVSRYEVGRSIKLWPGAEFSLKMFVQGDVWETVRTLRVGDPYIDPRGVQVPITDTLTGEVLNASHIPTQLFKSGLAIFLPQRPQIERSVKLLEDGRYVYGITTWGKILSLPSSQYTLVTGPTETNHVSGNNW